MPAIFHTTTQQAHEEYLTTRHFYSVIIPLEALVLGAMAFLIVIILLIVCTQCKAEERYLTSEERDKLREQKELDAKKRRREKRERWRQARGITSAERLQNYEEIDDNVIGPPGQPQQIYSTAPAVHGQRQSTVIYGGSIYHSTYQSHRAQHDNTQGGSMQAGGGSMQAGGGSMQAGGMPFKNQVAPMQDPTRRATHIGGHFAQPSNRAMSMTQIMMSQAQQNAASHQNLAGGMGMGNMYPSMMGMVGNMHHPSMMGMSGIRQPSMMGMGMGMGMGIPQQPSMMGGAMMGGAQMSRRHTSIV